MSCGGKLLHPDSVRRKGGVDCGDGGPKFGQERAPHLDECGDMRRASRQRSQDRLRGVIPGGRLLDVCLKFFEDVLFRAGDDTLRVDGELGADPRHFVAELALLESEREAHRGQDDDERERQSASPALGPRTAGMGSSTNIDSLASRPGRIP